MQRPDDDLALGETLAAPARPSSRPSAPGVIDWAEERYERLELLGRGGMGEVELLRDRRIGRDIARKRMHRDLDGSVDGLGATRFLREATVQGRLEHPSIVPVYDLGREAGGTYFTMKRIRGETLSELLARGLVEDESQRASLAGGPRRWARRGVLGAFVQVSRAVHFAHTRGVVHRDLKPANIMLGEFGEVYVLDWGLAKTLEDPGANAPIVNVAAEGGRLTREPPNPYGESVAPRTGNANATEAGTFLGTLGYMAPEQVIDAARVDARADVYALGTILFEIFADRPLHERISPTQLLADTLTPVDVRARLADRAPPEIERLLVAALSLEPGGRPADAGAVADVVQRYLDGDRDLALRRSLGEAHRARAETLAKSAVDPQRAMESALADRREALAEVGRALALDPQSGESLRVLISLLETPPREVPAEVKSAISVRETENRAVLAWRGALTWLAALAVVPAMALMGVRSWWAIGALTLLAAAGAAHAARMTKRQGQGIPLSAMLSGAVFVAFFSLIFGPLWLGMLAALACLVPWLTVGAPSQRWHAIGLASGGVVIPLALQLAGVIPSQYAIRDGALVISPLLLDFAPLPTFVFLGAVCALAIIVVAQFATTFRDEVDRSERSLRLLAWQLRQLAPAREAKTAE